MHYFAPLRGVVDTAPGLFRLSVSGGNGEADHQIFQFDTEFSRYRENKLRCRKNHFGRHVLALSHFSSAQRTEVSRAILSRLLKEHAAFFRREEGHEGGTLLHCALTGERLHFDLEMGLTAEGENSVEPPYRDGFDALINQVQEDAAVLRGGEDFANLALHVCAPTRWAPEEKLGRSFFATHQDVPHFERVNRASGAILKTILDGEPRVRFNWGIEFSSRLDLHPENLREAGNAETDRNPPLPQAFGKAMLRVERQTLWGLPEIGVLLFLIRIYHSPLEGLSREEKTRLASGLRSMSPETLRYKGMTPETNAALANSLDRSMESEPPLLNAPK